MQSVNNKLTYILLSLVILATFLLGLFLDWERMYYSSAIIVGIGVIFIWIFSSQIKSSHGNQNATFIFFSLLNLSIYSIVSFSGYTGGVQGMMLVLSALIIIGVIYVKLMEHMSSKVLGIFIHLFVIACFI
jgi:hypothetical protein